MEKLYKKDSKGKILEWSAEYEHTSNGVDIHLYSGEINGKITKTVRAGIKGKNIGKSNETSPLTQAVNEIESLYKRKKDLGYKSLIDLNYNFGNGFDTVMSISDFLNQTLTKDTTDAAGNLKPMKAQQYYRSKKDWVDNQGNIWKDRKYFYLLNPYERKERGAIIIGFPCLIQPKINGVRCTISLDENNNVQILSKEGKRYNLPHIEEVFVQYKSIFTVYKEDEQEEIFFDGELYIHGEKLQVISSAVKAPNLDTSRVKFVCFDLGTTLFSNLKRIQLMKQLITQLTSHIIDASVEYLATYRVGSDAIVQSMTDKFIEQGYEGSILREEFGVYAFGKRPMSMVKLKRVMDTEFLIVDIIPQEKDNNLGLYVCRTSEGKEFNVTPTGNNEFKSLILFQKHLYIGKMLTCKFYEYTEAGIPFHVLDNIVRDYE